MKKIILLEPKFPEYMVLGPKKGVRSYQEVYPTDERDNPCILRIEQAVELYKFILKEYGIATLVRLDVIASEWNQEEKTKIT